MDEKIQEGVRGWEGEGGTLEEVIFSVRGSGNRQLDKTQYRLLDRLWDRLLVGLMQSRVEEGAVALGKVWWGMMEPVLVEE